MHFVVPSADLEANRRSVEHCVVRALEEAIEEARLHGQSFRGVIRRPLAAPMRVEKAMLRADAAEGLEAAARMQSLVREAAAHQGRHVDALEGGRARGPKIVPV